MVPEFSISNSQPNVGRELALISCYSHVMFIKSRRLHPCVSSATVSALLHSVRMLAQDLNRTRDSPGPSQSRSESERLRPTKVWDPARGVACVAALDHFASWSAASKTIPDDPCVPEDGILHSRLPMIAHRFLPSLPSDPLHRLNGDAWPARPPGGGSATAPRVPGARRVSRSALALPDRQSCVCGWCQRGSRRRPAAEQSAACTTRQTSAGDVSSVRGTPAVSAHNGPASRD